MMDVFLSQDRPAKNLRHEMAVFKGPSSLWAHLYLPVDNVVVYAVKPPTTDGSRTRVGHTRPTFAGAGTIFRPSAVRGEPTVSLKDAPGELWAKEFSTTTRAGSNVGFQFLWRNSPLLSIMPARSIARVACC